MIAAYFGVPVQVEEFVGQWQDLIDDVRSRLPDISNRKGQMPAWVLRINWLQSLVCPGQGAHCVRPLNKQEFYHLPRHQSFSQPARNGQTLRRYGAGF